MSKKTCDIVRSLMREGREIQDKISRLEPDMSEDDEDDRPGGLDEGRTCLLLKLHFRLQQIKTEMEVLENPALREILVKNQESLNGVCAKRHKNSPVECCFVWLGGSLEETIRELNKTRNFLSADIFVK